MSRYCILLSSLLYVVSAATLKDVSNGPKLDGRSTLTVSPDASCGGTNGYTCLGSSFGSCCSSHGWCGSTSAYCGPGCQSSFGTCTGSTTSSTKTLPTSTATSTAKPSSTAVTLAECLMNENVPISLISSPGFAQLAEPYNLRLSYIPAVIVLPTTPQHISSAVICASESKVKVQARSGGHSYASFSSGGQNGSMVIDLEGFQNITVNAAGVAQVGGGVRLGNLAEGIYNQSQRALPHGTCPGVGIGGHFTHGGYGYDSRTWGLALDSIIGLDVVLANGSFVHASSTAYADIYYALRGAAESFGIITDFYLQTQPAPTTVINWSFTFANIFSSSQIATNTFLHIQDFAQNASVINKNIGFGMYMDGTTFRIGGTFFGPLNRFNTDIKPELLRTLPTPASQSIQSLGWIASLTALAGEPLTQPLTGYNAHDDFFAKSIVSPESAPLTSAALTSYFEYIINEGVHAPNPWYSIINLYGGPGSQINAQSPSSAAYPDRTSLWVFQHYGFTGAQSSPFPSAIEPYITGLSNALISAQPQTTFGAYLNYVDPSLTAAQAHQLYYGSTVYAKLLALKQEVDPTLLFWNPQAIGA